MAKFNYDPLKNTGFELIDKFGQECKSIKEIPKPHNPWDEPETEIKEFTGYCVKDKLSHQYTQSVPHLIQGGDVMLICTPSLELKAGDIVIISEDEKWEIVDPRPVAPRDEVIIYEAHARLK